MDLRLLGRYGRIFLVPFLATANFLFTFFIQTTQKIDLIKSLPKNNLKRYGTTTKSKKALIKSLQIKNPLNFQGIFVLLFK